MHDNNNQTLEDRVKTETKRYVKNYLVDTSAGSIYYTALMIPVELGIFLGDMEKLTKSRLYAIGVGVATHWFYRLFRQWWATSVWHAGPESSKWKKRGVEFTARLTFQVPLYIGGLIYADATRKESYIAVPVGLILGIATASYYGKFLERWRKYWGFEPTLYK